MSAQLARLQQTLQMSILDKSLTDGASGVINMLEEIREQQSAVHPYKGEVTDLPMFMMAGCFVKFL